MPIACICESPTRIHLGILVHGKLRLSKISGINNVYRLRIWEFNHNVNEYGPESWSLMHEVIEVKRKRVIAFHPYNGNVIFLLRDYVIWRHMRLEQTRMKKLTKLPSDFRNKFVKALTIMHLLCPTAIPALASI